MSKLLILRRLAFAAGTTALLAIAIACSRPSSSDQPPLTPQGRVLNSHDDPIVVDNEHIEVSRETRKGDAVRIGSDKTWALDEMDKFTHIKVWARSKGNQEKEIGPIAGQDPTAPFELDVMEDNGAPPTGVLAISQIALGGLHKHGVVASLHNDLEFMSENKGIKDKKDKLHVAQIRFGSQRICLAETGLPVESACGAWKNLPKKVRIELCANVQCEIGHNSAK